MIKILGSSGDRNEQSFTTCIQVSAHTVIDAGNIMEGLREKAIEVDNIFLSHSHLDHVLDCAFLCESFLGKREKSLKIYALKETIASLKKHFFNWEIWPDFTEIKLRLSGKNVLEFVEVELDVPLHVDGVTLTPIKANHTVACCGYLIEKNGSGILFSGDTYLNDRLWEVLNNSPHIRAVIVDVSFPSNLEDIAKQSKHLTPQLLQRELKKLKRDDVEIYINHIKSNYQEQVKEELKNIGIPYGNILTGFEAIDYSVPKIIRDKRGTTYTQRVKMLNKIGTELSLSTDLISLLSLIVTEAKNLTNADGGTLYLLNEKKQELDFTVIQTDSLDIYLGGTNGKISWSSLPLYLEDKRPNKHMVAVTCVLEDRVINIPDVYEVENFNFTGTKKFDALNGYRSYSMLVIPMKNHEKQIIGVLQLINKTSQEKIVAFDSSDEEITLSLASQAAVSITNANLIRDLEKLLEGFLNSIIYALKHKSPYTANHIYKMVALSKMIAKAVNDDEVVYKDKKFSSNDFEQINFAALMHDIGKLSTPDFILDKSTKLHGLHDKIEVIRTRVRAMKKELELEFLKQNILEDEFNTRLKEVDFDFDLLVKSNAGSEFMSDEDVKKIYEISKKEPICSSESFYMITQEEAKCLMVKKGTITDKERDIVNNHAQISLDILNRLPFPKKYKNIPSIAGAHHEKLNGKGYPLGLKGDKISFEARILAIADVFEALTANDRPYKKANTLSTAMEILLKMAKNNELDSGLVKFFYDSGLYIKFAKKALKSEQIDEVVVDFSKL